MLRNVVLGGRILLSLMLVAGAVLLAIDWYGRQPVVTSQVQGFTIDRGDSLGRVARRLEARGMLEYPQLFSLMGRLSGLATELQAGDYQVQPGTAYRALLTMFTQGQVRYYDVTLVEGYTFAQALEKLNAHPKLTQPLSSRDLPGVFTRLGIDGAVEGLFYPDTYFFEAGATVESILTMAHKKLNQVLAEEWAGRAEGLPLQSPYEALTLSSIIEKETGVAFERPAIAGVFVRRLQRGMRLQSDPTVIYGMGARYAGQLNRRLLREKTPYNTYVIKGLPPTPIALAGRAAINAALHPAEGDALYFVAKGDGTHYFSTSLAEHNRAVRKYQVSERRADYRSTVEVN